jgi:N-acyl-L-homoserine lactone synthetase
VDFFEADGLVFQLATDWNTIEAALRLRHDVYVGVGYVEPFKSGIIPDPKNCVSDYIVAKGEKGAILGTIRLTPLGAKPSILGTWAKHLSSEDLELLRDVRASISQSVELGSLAAKKNGASLRAISAGLYKATLLYSEQKDFKYWMIAIDTRVLRALEMFGWHVQKIGSPIHYVGSPTILGVMEIGRQRDSIKQKNRRYYEYITSGQ